MSKKSKKSKKSTSGVVKQKRRDGKVVTAGKMTAVTVLRTRKDVADEIAKLRESVEYWKNEYKVTEEARESFETAYNKEIAAKKNGKSESVEESGKNYSFKPKPPKKQLLHAVAVLSNQLVKETDVDFATVGKATLTDLVGDLRRQDLLTRKEAIKFNKRYGLGLIL